VYAGQGRDERSGLWGERGRGARAKEWCRRDVVSDEMGGGVCQINLVQGRSKVGRRRKFILEFVFCLYFLRFETLCLSQQRDGKRKRALVGIAGDARHVARFVVFHMLASHGEKSSLTLLFIAGVLVQYGLAQGANVIGVDAGEAKKRFVEGLGARFVDFSRTADLVGAVRDVVFNAAAAAAGDDGGGEKREQQQQQQQGGVTAAARSDGGCHAVVVTSGHPAAFTHAAELLRVGGTLCCVGIPPGEVRLSTPIASIVIRGLKIVGNLVGSLAETLEAVEYVRSGQVQVHVEVRPFEELVEAYAALESGDVPGRVVLEVARGE
jgi:hypothetical protein